MGVYKAEGVVLRRRVLGEADRVITFYTREHGKVDAAARGVRRGTSRLAGRLEPFTHLRLLLAHGRTLDVVAQAEVVAALAAVDFVVIFDEDTAAELVGFIRPDIYVKGGDYAGVEANRWPEAEVVRAYGGEVRTLGFAPGHSTSEIIRKIAERYGRCGSPPPA